MEASLFSSSCSRVSASWREEGGAGKGGGVQGRGRREHQGREGYYDIVQVYTQYLHNL